MKRIFETHAHFDDEWFDEDRDELLTRLLNEEVAAITNIGADIETSRNSVRLAGKYDRIFAAVGVHPDVIGSANEPEESGSIEILRELADNPKVVAIGEIGLDYYERAENEKNVDVRNGQKYWFYRQLELARELKLPAVIHSREAAEDTYGILKDFGCNKGVIHCYSYSAEMAERFVKLGFFIGIGGVVTFKNAKKTKETVKRVGIDNIVLETDSPYLAPVPFRGKRNDSGNIKYAVTEIASILGISEEEVMEKTFNNALKLYELEDKDYVKLC